VVLVILVLFIYYSLKHDNAKIVMGEDKLLNMATCICHICQLCSCVMLQFCWTVLLYTKKLWKCTGQICRCIRISCKPPLTFPQPLLQWWVCKFQEICCVLYGWSTRDSSVAKKYSLPNEENETTNNNGLTNKNFNRYSSNNKSW
jgi:hypothetical protein